jgi:hypothetical protein
MSRARPEVTETPEYGFVGATLVAKPYQRQFEEGLISRPTGLC